MNRIMVVGNVCADPIVGQTPQGIEYARMSVADNRRSGGEQETQYWRVTAWRNLANIAAKYIHKGDKLTITGQVSVGEYTAQDGTKRTTLDITADGIEFMSRKDAGQDAPVGRNGAPLQTVNDDLPF